MKDIQVRRANSEDVDAIYALTSEMAERGFMLPRTKYKIVTMLTSFQIAENSKGEVVGCGAFSMLWTDMGEIMALAVNDAYWGKGVGKKLVGALIDEGRRLKVKEVFTLTYQVDFFKKLGFSTTDKDRFPRKLWRECLECPKLENCDETAMHLFI